MKKINDERQDQPMNNVNSVNCHLQTHREKKNGILDDMCLCISYQPNRNNDLLAWMEQYLKSDAKSRPRILDHLQRCMDGKPYPNPYQNSYAYTEHHVALCGKILDRYIDRLLSCDGDENEIANCLKQSVSELNILNEQCSGGMVDTWRRERLCGFLNEGAVLAGIVATEDLTLPHLMW